MVTDPPYNVALGTKNKPTEAKRLHRRSDGLVIMNDEWDSEQDFTEFLKEAFSIALSHISEGASFYIWHASNSAKSFIDACEQSSMEVRQTLIWVKNTFTLGRQDYQWQHEPCLYGWKDGAAHYFCDSRKESTVINEDKPQISPEHPTMKPIGLIGRLIKNSSKEGWAVLDPFGGSGSTLIACEQLNRKCYMMELDPHYCDVILQRWEAITGDTARKIACSV